MSFNNSKWWPFGKTQPSPKKAETLEQMEYDMRHLERRLRRERAANFELKCQVERFERAVNAAENSVELADDYIEELLLGSNTFHESEAEQAYTHDKQCRLPKTRPAK